MTYSRIIHVIFFVIAIFLFFAFMPDAFAQNLWRVKINKAWTRVGLTTSYNHDKLHDGIPDHWSIQSWGDARWIIKQDLQESNTTDFVVRLERTNNQGVVALTQEMSIEAKSPLICTVFAKGTKESESALQLLFRTSDEDWKHGRWLDVEDNGEWQQYRLMVTTPNDSKAAMLRLRTRGLMWFSEAYCAIEENERTSLNLLLNANFEEDGLIEDSLVWWRTHITGTKVLDISERYLPTELAYLNVIDMLAGRYNLIQKRAQQLDENCVDRPDMISWLLIDGKKFEQSGGAAARERLYQLAIQLAPNCPQPYAVLADLYRSFGAYERAAEFYLQAAKLSGDTPLAGRYYFEAGFLHIRHTGDNMQALELLQQANQISGWNVSPWYQGASLFYLSLAYENIGDVAMAIQLYERVLSCAICTDHRDLAQQKLESLLVE